MFDEHNPMTHEEFREDYLKRYPSKVLRKPQVYHVYPKGFGVFIGFMFVCAAILSGVHTIPTTYIGIEASVPEIVRLIASIGSFVAVELALFSSAYMMVTEGDRPLGWTVLILSSAVALTSNLWSVSKAINQAEGSPEGGAIIVVIILGICMPAIALASGKLFVNVHRSHRKQNIEAEEKQQQMALALDEEIVSEYEKYLAKINRRTRRTSVQSVSAADGQSGQAAYATGHGYNKQMDAQDRVRAYLEANPEAFEMSVRSLADELGVGKSTVADVRRTMMNGQSNGHA